MNQLIPQHLLEELDLGSARGGKAGINRVPVQIDLVRELTEDDLPAISSPPAVAAQGVAVKSLRHSHHRLAELMAKGLPGTEISLVTGYSQSYISNIKHDPAFAELVSYYESQKQSVFLDAMERLKILGIDATEKLHDQLNDPTATWSHRELMELVDMAVVKPATAQPKTGAASAGPSLQLEVKFVGARPGGAGPVVEAQFTDVTPER